MSRRLAIAALSLWLGACADRSPEPVPVERSRDFGAIVSDRSRGEAERLAAGLRLAGEDSGAAVLASLLAGDPAFARVVLDAVPPPQDVALGAALLDRTKGEEKVEFAAFLAGRGARATEPVAKLLSQETDWETQVQALQVLGKVKAETAMGLVRTKLQDRSTWIRMASAHALGEIGGEAAVAALEQALFDPEDGVVAAALIALGRTGHPDAVPLCVQKLSDDNPRVRAAAASAIGRLGTPGDTLLLRRLLDDPDEGVRFKAEGALEALTPGL